MMPCSMDPHRELLAEAELRSPLARYDGRSNRSHLGKFDDLTGRVARLEAVVAELSEIVQALIDRGKL